MTLLINKDLVSVVVNCYNSERFLAECISSILNQTYTNFEIIIWDNCSTDTTNQIALNMKYSNPKLKYFKGEKFVPLGSARNFAIKECRGDWIAFLDSDDLWDPNFLSDQMVSLKGNEKKLFGFGNATIFFESDVPPAKVLNPRRIKSLEGNIFKKLLMGNFVYFSSLVISRNALDYLKKFNEDFVQAEDYEALLRLASKYNAIQSGHIYYRLHESNTSKKQNLETFLENAWILEPHLRYRNALIHYSINIANYFLFNISSIGVLKALSSLSRIKFGTVFFVPGLSIYAAHKVKNRVLN